MVKTLMQKIEHVLRPVMTRKCLVNDFSVCNQEFIWTTWRLFEDSLKTT